MTKQIIWWLLFSLPIPLFAQSRHTIKTDLTALNQKGGRLAYEFQLNPKSSLELSIGFQKHENQPDWLFHGDYIIHYLQRKLDTFDYRGNLVSSTGWQNEDSEALPEVPEFLLLQSTNFRLGWRFNFKKEHSNWRFFLQPGFMIAAIRYFEIKGETRLEKQTRDIWITGTYPYTIRIDRESAVYEQTRMMRRKDDWTGGVTYDVGFVRKWGKHFFLEGRVSAGGNLVVPYKSPRPPLIFRGLWAQPVVMAGWRF
jgi:hypothetical protein